jgi:hypothetical protein
MSLEPHLVQISCLTLLACRISHPLLFPFNLPKESANVQKVASLKGRGTLRSPFMVISLRVNLAHHEQQSTYYIDPHTR